jgi:hypothetical protein
MFTHVSKGRKALSRNQRLMETRLMEVNGVSVRLLLYLLSLVIPLLQKPEEKLNLNLAINCHWDCGSLARYVHSQARALMRSRVSLYIVAPFILQVSFKFQANKTGVSKIPSYEFATGEAKARIEDLPSGRFKSIAWRYLKGGQQRSFPLMSRRKRDTLL